MFRYSPEVWEKKHFYNEPDISAPFAPVNQIRLYCRSKPGNNFSSLHRYHCFYFCLAGEGVIEINKIPYMLRENEAIGVLPYSPHCRIYSERPVHYLLARFVPVNPQSIRHLFEVKLHLNIENRGFIQSLIDTYEALTDINDIRSCNELALKLSLVINSLNGCVQEVGEAKKTGNLRIDKAINLLLSTEHIDLPLQEIARRLNITRGHLTDLIHDALGYSPRHIRRMLRLRTARNFLEDTSLSIMEISEAVGFKSVYAFSNFFKKFQGISPTAYRKQFTGKSWHDNFSSGER